MESFMLELKFIDLMLLAYSNYREFFLNFVKLTLLWSFSPNFFNLSFYY